MRIATLLLLAAPVFAGDVHIVDASGGGDFSNLPAAVAAASRGDVLLVRAGTYTAPTIDKGLTVVAEQGAIPVVRGTTRIHDVPKNDTVLLSGLALRHRVNTVEKALEVWRCKGAVRFDKSSATSGGFDSLEYGNGRVGADVRKSRDVAFMRSRCEGGTAGENEFGGPFIGGAGLRARNSSVASWRCEFEGGAGSPAALFLSTAATGGFGAKIESDSTLHGYLSLFRGGAGGDTLDFSSDWCGQGGIGLRAIGHAELVEQTCYFLGGPGGDAVNFPTVCANGAGSQIVGPQTSLSGVPRGIEGPRLLREGQTGDYTVFGVPGDRVFVGVSYTTDFRPAPYFKGGWIAPPTLFSTSPIGVIPGSGTLNWSALQPALPTGDEGKTQYVQILVESSGGEWHLGSAIAVVAIDDSF